jgi:hypothetical protein
VRLKARTPLDQAQGPGAEWLADLGGGACLQRGLNRALSTQCASGRMVELSSPESGRGKLRPKNRGRNGLATAAPSFNCAVKFLRLPGPI